MTELWNRLKDLPLCVERYRLVGLELTTQSGFRRLTTEVHIEGRGHTGSGEDVVWTEEMQLAFRERGAILDLAGTFTLAQFSERLEEVEMWSEEPPNASWKLYRRWAFESAALDLALRQNELSLGAALGLEPQPLRFCTSLGLHDFATIETLQAIHANMEFKLDATPDWSSELCEQLAATGAVQVVDFKGAYVGTPVDVAADLGLYARVLDAMPHVIVEDPHDTPEVGELLRARDARVAWDAPIHLASDVDRMPFACAALNIKPSRFGTMALVLEAYALGGERQLELYGGGQFEIGVGRRQIQLLASLFHASGANDVAPRGYHRLDNDEARPASPLSLDVAPTGFELREESR